MEYLRVIRTTVEEPSPIFTPAP